MTTATRAEGAADPQEGRTLTRSPRRRLLYIAGGMFLLLVVVRLISGEHALTSGQVISTAVAVSVPLALVGLGGLISERAGVVNIGLEGMMILGTWGAGYAGYQWGWSAAIVGGVLFGMLGGLLHALATVTFGVDHVISGVAINILALGVVRFLSEALYEDVPGGGPSQSPTLSSRQPELTLPGFSSGPNWLGDLEARHWPVVSDLAGVLRGLTTDIGLLSLATVALVIGTYLLLWQTPFGLRLRSCGENPTAADSLGVPVYRMKYIAVVASGALAGLGGVALVFAANFYLQNQTNGRGYIGLAAVIFGNWRPGGMVAGAVLFGYADAMERVAGDAIPALLLLVAILLGIAAIWQWRVGRQMLSAIAAGVSVASLIGYLSIDELPGSLVSFTPYLITLLVLSLASQRLRPPKADGLVWRRGEQ
ncbi:ABC transporter permease [Blastococcus sp. URHD0036]|uniref:ABC transporter permease n=1 Tax=Blastococcus sp. URHD0036 TaxID=1380356 RepID=UPI00049724F5|nr:ABC transporter permease [Blastococcus sp. URHD0036]